MMSFRRLILLAALCSTAIDAWAACSRPIIVPASQIGMMVSISDDGRHVAGIYPDLLRAYGGTAGCTFLFPVIPRLRAEKMVEAGRADVFLGAVQLPTRDAWGGFIPMLGSAWTLISIGRRPPPASVRQLLQEPGLKFNAVRGFDDGPAYELMLAELDKIGKLEYVNDAVTIVRKMAVGRTTYTFMPSITFAGAVHELGLTETLGRDVTYSKLNDIPPAVTGVYISSHLNPGDAAQVKAILVSIREHHELLTQMHAAFSAAEMVTYYDLRAR